MVYFRNPFTGFVGNDVFGGFRRFLTSGTSLLKGLAHEGRGFVVWNEGACSRFCCALVNEYIPKLLLERGVKEGGAGPESCHGPPYNIGNNY